MYMVSTELWIFHSPSNMNEYLASSIQHNNHCFGKVEHIMTLSMRICLVVLQLNPVNFGGLHILMEGTMTTSAALHVKKFIFNTNSTKTEFLR